MIFLRVYILANTKQLRKKVKFGVLQCNSNRDLTRLKEGKLKEQKIHRQLLPPHQILAPFFFYLCLNATPRSGGRFTGEVEAPPV